MNTLRYAWAALAAVPCFAQPVPSQLEPIVVTATGREMAVREALAATTIISRDEIERAQSTDLAELLRFHAGLELGRNGGPGSTTSVFMRGGESNHTLVLVDGVRINPATSGGAALQNIAPEMIERIEIVKGPRATLYGSEAIGGIVNVITRAAAAPAAELRIRGGSFGTGEAAGFFTNGDGRRGLALHAQHLRSDGFAPQPGAALDRGYRNTTANLRAQAQMRGFDLGFQAWNAQGLSEYVGFGGAADQDFHNQVLGAHVAARPADAWSTRIHVSRMLDDIKQNQSVDFVRTERSAAEWHNVLVLGAAQHLSMGARWAREDVSAALFGSPIAEDRRVSGAFVQYEIADRGHRGLAALGFSDHDAFGSQLNWNAEYGYDLLSSTRLIAAAATGFRAPDATDRYGFGGNPDLQAEHALSIEAGLRQALGSRQTAELRLFRSEVEDLISVECVADCTDADPFNDTFRAINVDTYRNQGVELAWQLEAAVWSARASLLRQQPRSVARPDPCSGGERLCRRSDLSAALTLVRHWGAFAVGLDALASGDRADFGGRMLPGYALFNVTADVDHARWRVGVRLENVLDRDYQTAAGFAQAARSAYLTLGWRM